MPRCVRFRSRRSRRDCQHILSSMEIWKEWSTHDPFHSGEGLFSAETSERR
jgi:hypothetical protein